MNKVVLCGRLTKDPDVRYTQAGTAVARYTLAVDRRAGKDGKKEADFISCVAWDKKAEFAEKYLSKGIKINVFGHIQTGSYTGDDGVKRYTTDVIVEEQEFCESRAANDKARGGKESTGNDDGFVDVPDEIDEELPFV